MDTQGWTIIITALTTAICTILGGIGGWYLKVLKLYQDFQAKNNENENNRTDTRVTHLADMLNDLRKEITHLKKENEREINLSERREQECRTELNKLREQYLELQTSLVKSQAELEILKEWYKNYRLEKDHNELPPLPNNYNENTN